MQAYLPPDLGPQADAYDAWARGWFSCQGKPLCSRQVPVGLLLPHAHGSAAPGAVLELQVHFRSNWPRAACPFAVPSEAAGRAHMLSNARHMFFNSLKEAVFILTGAHLRLPVLWRRAPRSAA